VALLVKNRFCYGHYDANEECDYDKFEELIKGIKINGEK